MTTDIAAPSAPQPAVPLTAAQKVSVLIDAMPWIEEFRGTIVVVKYGGNAMIDE